MESLNVPLAPSIPKDIPASLQTAQTANNRRAVLTGTATETPLLPAERLPGGAKVLTRHAVTTGNSHREAGKGSARRGPRAKRPRQGESGVLAVPSPTSVMRIDVPKSLQGRRSPPGSLRLAAEIHGRERGSHPNAVSAPAASRSHKGGRLGEGGAIMSQSLFWQ